jgi:hypothetical protein
MALLHSAKAADALGGGCVDVVAAATWLAGKIELTINNYAWSILAI